MRIGFEGGRATARTLLKEGEHRFCALSWSEHPPPTTSDEAYERLVWTAHHWQHWLARGHFPDHPWRGYLQRSALTLKGLTFAPTGALVAAATTSLPETPGGERNWDYRYSWIRDATFALWALYTLGFDWEANDFFWFIADVAERDEDLQVMYGVDGRARAPRGGARPPPRLRGRPAGARSATTRTSQRQHDVWGAVLDSVYLHTKSRDGLDERIWSILVHQVESALASGASPTRASGRSAASRSTSRRPSSCAGSRSTAAPAWPASRARTSWPSTWEAARPRRSRTTSAPTASTSGACSPSTTATDALDASLLLMPLVRFLPADDPRVRGDGAGDRRRAHRRRPGAALQGRGDRRRPRDRGGRVPHLLVLAGLRPLGDRRPGAGPSSCARSCCRWPARSTSTPRRSTPTAAATSATSRRPSPTWR